MSVEEELARGALDALDLADGARLVVRGAVEAGPLAVAVARAAIARGVRPTFALGLADCAADPLLDEAPAAAATVRLVTAPAAAILLDDARPAAAAARALPVGDPRLDRMARVVVERMLDLRAGQRALILGYAAGLPLVERIAWHASAAGALPCVRLLPDGLERALLDAPPEALAATDPVALHAWQTADALVRVHARSAADDLADVPADRIAAAARGRGPLREVHLARSAAGALRWAVTLHPCAALAEEAGLELAAYADLVYAAAFADLPDPVAAWEEQAARQAGLVDVLAGTRELRFTAPGTDIRLRVDGRAWRSSAGNRNLPDGEVFTGPLEHSAEGVVEFTYPIAKEGRVVEGIRLVFAAGRVVEATARRGEDVLRALLDQDEGARRLGEVGIGTNMGLDRFTGQILLDEKIGGSFHLALGAGYPETGSTNRSGEHWDMICDLRSGGEILADGVPIQRDGRFLPASGYGRP